MRDTQREREHKQRAPGRGQGKRRLLGLVLFCGRASMQAKQGKHDRSAYELMKYNHWGRGTAAVSHSREARAGPTAGAKRRWAPAEWNCRVRRLTGAVRLHVLSGRAGREQTGEREAGTQRPLVCFYFYYVLFLLRPYTIRRERRESPTAETRILPSQQGKTHGQHPQKRS